MVWSNNQTTPPDQINCLLYVDHLKHVLWLFCVFKYWKQWIIFILLYFNAVKRILKYYIDLHCVSFLTLTETKDICDTGKSAFQVSTYNKRNKHKKAARQNDRPTITAHHHPDELFLCICILLKCYFFCWKCKTLNPGRMCWHKEALSNVKEGRTK